MEGETETETESRSQRMTKPGINWSKGLTRIYYVVWRLVGIWLAFLWIVLGANLDGFRGLFSGVGLLNLCIVVAIYFSCGWALPRLLVWIGRWFVRGFTEQD